MIERSKNFLAGEFDDNGREIKKPKKKNTVANILAGMALTVACSEEQPPIKHEIGGKAFPELSNYGEISHDEKSEDVKKKPDLELVFDPTEVANLEEKYGADHVQKATQYIRNGHNFRLLPQDEKQSRLSETKGILKNKYSNRIKIPKFFGFVDDQRELQQVCSILWNIDEIKRRAGKKRPVHITPEFVIAAMSNEGNILDIRGQKDQWESEVSGFQSLGLDTFASNVDDIIDRGLLPKSFKEKYKASQAMNEKGQMVQSARFVSKGDAIRAFVSELAIRQMDCQRHLKQKNIDITDISEQKRNDIILFITYIYYNAGPTVGRNIINSLESANDLVDYFDRAKNNPESINLKSAPANAYVVMAGMEWMTLCGIFDEE